MKNRFKKLPIAIITFLIVIAFSLNIVDSTVFARGSGTTKSSSGTSRSAPSTTTKTTPKSGAKSGSFSNTKPSSSDTTTKTTPSSGTKSGSFSNTTNPTSNSSGSNVSSGSSWHMPAIIFWPHRTLYYDSYGSHYGYSRPSLLSGFMDVIIFLAIIAFVIWIIKKRRR